VLAGSQSTTLLGTVTPPQVVSCTTTL
jgi:hypothetical protein